MSIEALSEWESRKFKMKKQIVDKTIPPPTDHRFLDEAGDTTFYGKGKIPIIGEQGVSRVFILGMVKFKQSLESLRQDIRHLQNSIEKDPYFEQVPSIQKKAQNRGFYFHATDDPPEVRKIFYDFIKTVDCSFEAVAGEKILDIYVKKHNGKEADFYADLLSHLLKNKFQLGSRLVLNIAERGKSTRNTTLQLALDKAVSRFLKNHDLEKIKTKVVFNVQNHYTEPLLNIADYLCWAVQRIFERGETRYYNFIQEKIKLVVDLYDSAKYENSRNYYTNRNPLTAKNKKGPH